MGFLKHLLFWPVTGPAFLTRFSLDQVEETVRRELTDDARIKEELLALQMELELDEIDDAEYVVREAELMRQLREVRSWRERLGMGVAGGPVQVSGRGDAEGAAESGADAGSAGPGRGGIAEPGIAELELRLDTEDDR